MWNKKVRIEKLNIGERRTIVVSDIHANLPYFRGLLEKVGFCGDDILIIDGDFLEKGADSLGALRYVMALAEKGNVHAVMGNCDAWLEVVDGAEYFTPEKLLKYMLFRKSGLCWDMFTELGITLREGMDITPYLPAIAEKFKPEWDYLHSIPQVIETPHYVFVHGGIYPDKPIAEHTAGECMKLDNFMGLGASFDKWVIVGHWPVVLYRENIVCASPVIDRERRIISIDGGCVLKDDGQLNALIIPHEGSEDFSFESYDPFPVRTVLNDQTGGKSSYYIRWGDNKVQVLSRGEEFSLCRHERTGYEMKILTKYLFTDEEHTGCNDCTDLVLTLRRGDRVSVVETVSGGYFVKHNGVSGWYWGELD